MQIAHAGNGHGEYKITQCGVTQQQKQNQLVCHFIVPSGTKSSKLRCYCLFQYFQNMVYLKNLLHLC